MISAMKSFRIASKITNARGIMVESGLLVLIDGMNCRIMFSRKKSLITFVS
jgi:hypothetical protein